LIEFDFLDTIELLESSWYLRDSLKIEQEYVFMEIWMIYGTVIKRIPINFGREVMDRNGKARFMCVYVCVREGLSNCVGEGRIWVGYIRSNENEIPQKCIQ
jgi:hypothetical protein